MAAIRKIYESEVTKNLKLLTYLGADIPIAGMHCGEFSLALIDIG